MRKRSSSSGPPACRNTPCYAALSGAPPTFLIARGRGRGRRVIGAVYTHAQSQSKLVFCEYPLNFPPFFSSSLHLFPSLTALTSHFPLCAFSQEIPRMSTPQRSRYPRPLKATQSFTSSSSGTTQPAKSQQQRGSPPGGSGRIGERRSSPERRSPGPMLGSSASGVFVGVVCC